MRIAFISNYLPGGSKIGVGYQAHYLANALVRRGHTVTIFSPIPRPADALYEVEVVPVGTRLRTFRFAWNLRRYDWTRFDILHAQTDDYWLMGKRRPFHLRTMYGSCWAEAIHIPGLKDRLRMALLAASEHLATLVADKTVAISENTRRCFPQIREVIPCGVDTARFRPGAHRSAHPTVLFVGTLRRRKRGWMLLKAFQETIRPRFPEAELWMVCEESVETPGVKTFCRIPEEELIECYQRAWVFCLPSSYEGFGVPYVEAMACGTPVVATPNAGAREVLGEGAYGVLAAPEELGEVIYHLLADPQERAVRAERGLRRAQEFSWDRVVDAYERVYSAGREKRRVAGVTRT
jgi:glycosyltransferase involved in cell wall biosynthesis